jgi:hypothetical protein
MLKHPKSKKLSLSTETVRSLADHELVAASGGLDTIHDCQILVLTNDTCQPTQIFKICFSKVVNCF